MVINFVVLLGHENLFALYKSNDISILHIMITTNSRDLEITNKSPIKHIR